MFMDNEFSNPLEKEAYKKFNECFKGGNPDIIQNAYNSYHSIIRNSHCCNYPYSEKKWQEVQKKYDDWKRKNN